jgi:hypothetical protein
MKPVMRALQTIAALQTETRDGPAEAGATWPTQRTPRAELEQSSPASCNGRKGRTEVSANSKATADLNRGSATADLNRGSGAPRIAEAKATISEAAFARHREISLGLISGTEWSSRPLAASHVRLLQLSRPRCF